MLDPTSLSATAIGHNTKLSVESQTKEVQAARSLVVATLVLPLMKSSQDIAAIAFPCFIPWFISKRLYLFRMLHDSHPHT